jgi:SulP family sulfate permease
MTMEVVNDITETGNPKPNQQIYALAAGNFVAGGLGTMGGGATIGESVINLVNGANGYYRISGLVGALTMFIFIMAASPVIEAIPRASLVGVMLIIVFRVFEWESLIMILSAVLPKKWRDSKHLSKWCSRKISRVDAAIIIIVVLVTMFTDLFTGVAAGTAVASIVHCWQVGFGISALQSEIKDADGKVVKKIYLIQGPLFFASAMRFPGLFSPKKDPNDIEIHFSDNTTSLHDYSALHALNVVGSAYKKFGKVVKVKHLNAKSVKILSKADQLVRHFDYVIDEEEVEEVKLSEPYRSHITQAGYENIAKRDSKLSLLSGEGSTGPRRRLKRTESSV